MSDRKPMVSLGVPVYNGQDYVRQALDSVLAQDFEDFEVLICDNASTDGTEEICREVAGADPRVRYHRNPSNLGISGNYRRTFELSSGRYFKWTVHDDLLAPSYVGACVQLLEQDSDRVVLAYPRTILIDGKGSELEHYEDRMDLRESTPSGRYRHLLEHLRLCHCGLGLIRRSALDETDLVGPYESSDVVLLAKLAFLGEFREHPEFLYRRRIHEESSFGSYGSKEAFAERMDPSNRGRIVMPRTRLFAESLRAIGQAPISAGEKARCASALIGIWGPRFWRVVGGEFKRLLVGATRRSEP